MGCGNCKASELSLIPTFSRELLRELLALHQTESDTSHYYNCFGFACIKNITRDEGSTALYILSTLLTLLDTVYTVFTLYTIQTAFH